MLHHDDRLLTVAEIGVELHVHPSAVTRWILRGLRRPDGSRIRLEAIRAGGTWRIRPSALHNFLGAMTPIPADALPTAPRSPVQRTRADRRAAARLEALGI
jgi:hypothetical protein